MSDDTHGRDGDSFDDLYRDAIDAGEIFEKPDINDWLDLGSNDAHYYEEAWDHAPLYDFSDGQMDAFVEMLMDMPFDEWEDMMEWWDDGGFWDWWDENYGET